MRRNEIAITIAVGLALAASAGAQTPLGTAFTYQGRLTDNGTPATGSYDLQFELFDASSAGNSVGGPQVLPSVLVSGGLFTAALDFGPAAFAGSARWLETGVRPGGTGGPFTILVPRQELTPSPNARFSATAPWAGVTGKPLGFADDVDDDVLGGLACAGGQVAKWNGSAWTCAADADTTYSAAAGLNLTGTVFSLANLGVTTAMLADNAVTSGKITDATIALADLGQNGCGNGRERTGHEMERVGLGLRHRRGYDV